MAVSNRPVFVQLPKITPASIVNADAANTKKTIFTAGVNGAKVTGVLATSTDTSAVLANLWLTRSATSYLLGSTTIAIAAGTDGAVATQDLLPTSLITLPIDNDGQPYLFLESGDTLQVSLTTQVTATKAVNVTCIGANF